MLAIQYVGSDRLRSCIAGDMLCAALQKLGVVGLVTDMGSRDFKGIAQRAPDFQLFCSGSVVSHGYGAFLDFGLTVRIHDLTIQPGDLLHGDQNGIVQVPLTIAQEVVKQAERIRAEEAAYFDYLQGDSYTYEGLKRRLGRPPNQDP